MPVPHPDPLSRADYSAVELLPGDAAVVMLDQRLLPGREEYVEIRSVEDVAQAITDMVVRGAPAIGIAAAYGMVLAVAGGVDVDAAASRLKSARPTAVNLAWAVDRMTKLAKEGPSASDLAAEARALHRADVEANRVMGRLGAEKVPDEATILTHCNAGALATGGYGTALGVVRAAHAQGKRVRVLADETRPYLQGSRLTAWELHKDGIDVELITDSSAASFFGRGEIDLAVVGSDRIVANGDVANKIGTYGVACIAHAHDRPFYVAAPWSTVDVDTPSGEQIPIEQRAPREVTHFGAEQLAPAGIGVRNPAFDVTPARLVSAIFTERGAIEPVNADGIRELSQAVAAPG